MKHLRKDSNDYEIEWGKHIKAWNESGFKVVDYCRLHNISRSSFFYWRKKLGMSPPTTLSVVPFQIENKNKNKSNARITVSVRDVYKVEVCNQFDAQRFREIMEVLKDL